MSDWIIGYGSLLWRPSIPFLERCPGVLHGFSRRFWQGSPDHRGTPEAPGRVVTLVPRDASIGVMAYRVEPAERDAIFATLDHREKAGYALREVTVALADGRPVHGQLYTAEPGNPSWVGPTPVPELACHIRDSTGPSGRNLEYLLRLERALGVLGHPDPHVSALVRALDAPWLPHLGAVPTADNDQLDRLVLALEARGIGAEARAEAAGFAVAEVARKRFLGDVRQARVVVLAGSGGNGTAARVAARRLASWGAELADAGEDRTVDLVIDGILGSRLRGEPTVAAQVQIRWAQGQAAPVLAIDVPSGVDGSTGPSAVAVRAAATVTLGLPKPHSSGEVYLADLGIPREVFAEIGLAHPPAFGAASVVRVG